MIPSPTTIARQRQDGSALQVLQRGQYLLMREASLEERAHTLRLLRYVKWQSCTKQAMEKVKRHGQDN